MPKPARIFATIALAAAAAAAAAADMPVPKVMSDAPASKGAWRIEMLEMRGAGAEQMQQMKQAMGGAMTVCQTAAEAMSRDQGKPGAEQRCTSRLVEDSATRAVVEVVCAGKTPSTTRSTITRAGAKAWDATVEQNEAGQARTMKMRMSHAGACSEKDSAVSMQKDSPACQQMRAQMGQMNPDQQCQGSGREQCLKMLADARARMDGMCR